MSLEVEYPSFSRKPPVKVSKRALVASGGVSHNEKSRGNNQRNPIRFQP